MFISAETLDGALLELYPKLLARTDDTVTATRGAFVEEIGVLIEITNSRARLSRSETRGKLDEISRRAGRNSPGPRHVFESWDAGYGGLDLQLAEKPEEVRTLSRLTSRSPNIRPIEPSL